MFGPIDYVVVGFRGNNFDGSIIRELASAVKQGIIRVVDLVFIVKDDTGNVLAGEYEDQSAEIKSAMDDLDFNNDTPLFTENDIKKVAEIMPEDTAAGVLIVEHLWAKGLKKALVDAGGMLIADGRIHPDAVESAAKELKDQKEE